MADPAHPPDRFSAELARLAVGRTWRVAAVRVDLASQPVVCTASLGAAGPRQRFEVGSITKALTGMLVAEGIERGEVSLGTRVGDVLSGLSGAEAGEVTLRELVTHTSGLPQVGWSTAGRAALLPRMLLGLDPHRGITVEAVLAQVARVRLAGRGHVRYSNLGGALAGHVVAAAALSGRSPAAGGSGLESAFDELLAARVFGPLGMTDSAVARADLIAPWGHSGLGLPRAPWVLGGYAPAGGALSTAADLGQLIRGLLEGNAPGIGSLDPIPGIVADSAAQLPATFWAIQQRSSRAQAPFVWHNGSTGGYSSFLMLSRPAGRGIAVLADTADTAIPERIAFGLFQPRPS